MQLNCGQSRWNKSICNKQASGDNNVSVIDTTTNTVTATVDTKDWPSGVAVKPDGTKVYVTNYSNGTVSVINTTNNTITAQAPVGSFPLGVAISPDGTKSIRDEQHS